MTRSSPVTRETLSKSQSLIISGDFTEAENILRDLVKQEPGNAVVHFRLGVSLQRQRKFDPALAEYKKAIELNPEMAGPYNQLGPILERRESADQALSFYADAVYNNPYNHIARINSALLLRKLGRVQDAQEHYNEAIKSQIERNVVNRTTISQRFIDSIGAKVYLEIGVAKGVNFHQIKAPVKVAVDPAFRIPGAFENGNGEFYYETSSDDFFEKHAFEVLQGNLGISFIDGLHTYEQSLKDILNSVEHQLPNGIVVIHDCNPTSTAAAHPVLDEAIARADYAGAWMGDVFKSILWIRANRPDLDATVLNCDCGVGVVRKRQATTPRLELSDSEVKTFSYEDLSSDRSNLLNLKPASYLETLLEP